MTSYDATPYDAMTPVEVADQLTAERKANGQSKTAYRLGHQGVEAVLTMLSQQPGGTWQQRWVAADADELFRDLLFPPLEHSGFTTRRERDKWLVGLQWIVEAGLVRPGLGCMLYPRAGRTLIKGVIRDHAEDVERFLDAASSDVQISGRVRRNLQLAAAAMILFTGKPLGQITPAEWVAAEQYRRSATRSHKARRREMTDEVPSDDGWFRIPRPISIATAYTAAVRAGLITPETYPEPGKSALPATLDRARAIPATLEALLEAHGHALPPKVRAMVFDAYTLEGGGLDHSSVKALIVALNTYMRHVQQLLPGHDSLEIPMTVRDQLLQVIKLSDVRHRKPGTKRTAPASFLGQVRTSYQTCDAAIRRHGLTDHLPAAGPFPWSPTVLAALRRKEIEHRRTKLEQTVRAHLSHLDGLVAAAHQHLEEAEAFVIAARAAGPGEEFLHNGTVYFRSPRSNETYHGTGRETVYVRTLDGPKKKFTDVEDHLLRVAKGRALVVLLRETGLRIEEVAELQIENLAPYTTGDLTIPVVMVNPSKQDRARTVALTPAALTALHDLIQRTRAVYGFYPQVARTDSRENVDQQPARLIFYVHHRRTFVGPSFNAFNDWLNEIVDYYNQVHNKGVALPPLRAHQMRRMFATDLAERGADVVAIQKTLGHKMLSTTGIYVYLDEARAIAEVAEARNRARAEFKGNLCSCCEGLGYHASDT